MTPQKHCGRCTPTLRHINASIQRTQNIHTKIKTRMQIIIPFLHVVNAIEEKKHHSIAFHTYVRVVREHGSREIIQERGRGSTHTKCCAMVVIETRKARLAGAQIAS